MATLIMTIPYYPNSLGIACNNIMEKLDGWVGFMDHDVYLANPNWYSLFTKAIDTLGEKAGFISCVTNRIGCRHQRTGGVNYKNHDILYHTEKAKEVYAQYGDTIEDITDSEHRPSGMVFVTHKKAWEDIGKFKVQSGTLGIDSNYAGRVKEKGYGLYILKGLYVYHRYRATK